MKIKFFILYLTHFNKCIIIIIIIKLELTETVPVGACANANSALAPLINIREKIIVVSSFSIAVTMWPTKFYPSICLRIKKFILKNQL